ncbi:MAG: lipoyl(octanoyl) transferase LipB [Opitutaceae bacterium]|nr:lipoyl(octanoyl) transferase LipB [Cytophagales bacterium]
MIPYQEAWDLQERLLKDMVESKIEAQTANRQPSTINELYFCEHPHVYTLGKSGKEENFLLNKELLKSIKAEYFHINRGGDITYHGPGQLVAYPIFDLENFFTDIHLYMRSLEEVIIQTCNHFGIQAGRVQGLTGVWIEFESANPRKIAALGVKTSRWVTIHGLALNVNTDLNYFNHIVPCGLIDKQVTSIEKELGRRVEMDEVKEVMKTAFLNTFQASIS